MTSKCATKPIAVCALSLPDKPRLVISKVVDTSPYPIDAVDSPAFEKLVMRCRQALDNTGLCLLPDFIRPDALEALQSESQRLTSNAHHTEHWRSSPNGANEDDHSELGEKTRAALGSIAFDKIGDQSPLRTLYQCGYFTRFLNSLFEGVTLFPTEDPLVSCMLTVLDSGDELGWHYDPNDIVVSLAVQQADSGGQFEFAPRIRAPAADATQNEEAVLKGTYTGTISKSLEPGTLSLFNGHRSLHRVAPVGEGTPRVIALFNYSETPGYRFDRHIHEKFFGRTVA